MAYAIDYLELPSADNAASRSFFERAFGWSAVDYGSSYAEICGGGLVFGVNSDPGDRRPAVLPVIRCDDLEAAERQVRAAGGEITVPAYDFPGGRRFVFREPGGSEMAVYIEVAA